MAIRKRRSVALSIALVGLMAASIECVKLALAFLPNVEAVTLLIALYSFTFGWLGIVAAAVFVCIEPLIWGFGTWFISYLIYWPLVAVVFFLFGRLKIKNRAILTLTAVGLTLFFGVLTSFVDVGLFSGSFDKIFYRFGIYYARGVLFYAVQTATNAVLFPLLFPTLSKKLSQLRQKMLI